MQNNLQLMKMVSLNLQLKMQRLLGDPVAAGGVWVQAGLLSEADSDAEWRLKTPPLAPHQADRPRNQANRPLQF